MHVRSATGSPVPTTSPPPLPAPSRWHLRTQVSRKTLFDLIQDTLPSAGLQVTSGPDAGTTAPDVPAAKGRSAGTGAAPPAGAAPGVLPQSYLDSFAATVPMPLNPAALWNDGDTTPDLPDHWRPITITLASTPALHAPALLPPPTQRPALPGMLKTAGWMLSGAALTFLIGAAAFGGRPMLRAVRAVTAPHAETTPAPLPANQTEPAPLPTRAPAPKPSRAIADSATVVAIAARPQAQIHPIVVPMPSSSWTDRGVSASNLEGDAGPDGDLDARKNGAAPPRAARRPRQDRRLAKAATSTEAGRADASLLGADDAVMPLAAAEAEPRHETWTAAKAPAPAKPDAVVRAPVATRSPAMGKTISSRVFRPIDVEDPFGGE